MKLSGLKKAERLEMMRKRQAYFSAVAEEYTSFADFIRTQDWWLAIMGIELTEQGNYLVLHIQLDYTDYEDYFIFQLNNGILTVSDVIQWQDEYCSNSYLNIETGESADEKDIPECY